MVNCQQVFMVPCIGLMSPQPQFMHVASAQFVLSTLKLHPMDSSTGCMRLLCAVGKTDNQDGGHGGYTVGSQNGQQHR